MRKSVFSISGSLLLVGVLAACNTTAKEEALEYNERTRPIGYYSNENINHNRYNQNTGNAYMMNDNDGAITEFMDRNVTNNKRNIAYKKSTNYNNAPMRFPATVNREPLADQSGYNYHGHLNNLTTPARSSYYTNYEGRLAEDISRKAETIPNVRAARTLVRGNDVIVACDTTGNQREVINDVQRSIGTLANGKNVKVVTDTGTLSLIRQIDNDIRNGGPRETINKSINDLFEGSINTRMR
ncbi:YhcN/YlaJ family sporulation lipoprotein [Bacillus sp. SM2101]|uniref:YhcN/YlaJ family sporulation lipoprotein n=1 Tax=Bacillus sp. SM2101 TaxID=2805366 RepID=UPI001BDDCD96|nr:YhcN/YlaJ family sporulation lipoprotein [Bacillus sp. SM2101]